MHETVHGKMANVEQTRLVVVDSIINEADQIRLFRVRSVGDDVLEKYEPGAHVDVVTPSGFTRQYSLCGDPACEDSYLFAVKREVGSRGGSSSLHEFLSVGSELRIGRPRNIFRLHDAAEFHLLIAAGIGITPLLSMAYRLASVNSPFVIHYFVRSLDQAAFAKVLSSPPFWGHVVFHVGVSRDAVAKELDDAFSSIAAGTHVYTCGPNGFMDKVVAAGERRLPPDSIHLERFQASPTNTSEERSDAGFTVKIASSGQTVRVAEGTTIVRALSEIGVEIETSCEEGICGTCIVGVLGGDIEHRDQCLSKTEKARNDAICCCVSRASSAEIVLDL
ncbi:ferredoxin [Caballeronia arvi]|uniref:Ferredoxin n=1 Tax=Caballeronia arvi TaxID=1777135 RepID=A0A158L1V7_9BURK|nr:PDR/VanB family oxidoreductase [Caballeronia arvi]SAL87332.1 ferredoxin [Caballeronia arvi]